VNIFNFSVKKPVTVVVSLIAILIIGLMYGSRINIEDFPQIDIPIISVTTVYRGAGPQEMEEQVTIPVEEAVGSVSNIDEIESTSQDNMSFVLVRFKYGTNMESAAADVREKLDRITNNLPRQADKPIITKADPGDSPIVRLALTGKGEDLRRLRSIATNDLKKELEKIGGIASVTVSGGEERAIMVRVDRNRLEDLGLGIHQVAAAVAKENQNIPSGRITASQMEFSVRSMGELKSVQDFESVMVAMVNGRPIYLKDLATIQDSSKEVRTIARYNGKPCVSLEVRKNRDANTVKVSDSVKEAVAYIQKGLPEGITLSIAYDDSKTIRGAIQNLKDNAIEGSTLAILVVLLFLGSFRSTMVVGMAIPCSIIATFLLMYFGKLTINMMTLLGFILAVGNIVDASIVVLENIFRHMEMGKDPVQAAVDGNREVGGAVLGGTLTVAIVFVPIMMMGGISGQVFRPLAKTFVFAILCSMAMAVLIVPMLCSRFLHGELERRKNPRSLMDKFSVAWEKFFAKIVALYSRALHWCLNHRAIVVTTAVFLLLINLYLAQFLKVELQGKWDRGDFLVSVEAPVGASLDTTRKVVLEVEDFILNNTPEYNSIISDVGQAPSGGKSAAAAVRGEVPRMGGFTVSLKSADERKKNNQRSMYDVQDMITDKYKNYAGARIQVTEMFSISGKKPLEILIRGNNQEKLAELATRLKEDLAGVSGLKNLDLNYRPGSPEFRVVVDRKKAGDLGIGSQEISATLRTLLSEDEASRYREEGNEYDIIVQLPEEQRDSVEKIRSLKFTTRTGHLVPLSEIASIEQSFGPSSISRRDRSRYVSVQADTTGRALSEVLKDVIPIVKKQRFPTGYNWILAGEEQRRQEIFADIFQALFLAIIMVYVFLAVQFESFVHPFTIMLTVPLELVGLFSALLITGSTMTMFALLGVVMLVGLDVSKCVILIDYIILRMEEGMEARQAVEEAAPLRLRPILMTVGSTIIAMIPLALGLRPGAQLFQSLAIGSIGGMASSTLLTLLVIPVIFTLLQDLQKRFFGKKIKTESVS
jgi:HAE1 family hydrophobic/amphiphilic exporter-1